MPEKCATCGKADSNGVPCALMFKEGTDIQTCSGHEEDKEKHANLAKKAAKVAKAAAKASDAAAATPAPKEGEGK